MSEVSRNASRVSELMETVGKTLRPPSPVVARLLSLLSSDDFQRSDIEKAMRSDASLVAQILRHANSARYSRREVSDLAYALTLLGAEELTRIAIRAGAACMRVSEVDGYQMAQGGLWQHSLRTAVACELLAKETKLCAPGLAYTAGIFLDVGKRVLGGELAAQLDEALALAHAQSRAFTEIESELLGCDHAEIGHSLAKLWRLPSELQAAIAFHHRPDDATEHAPLVWVCHVADFLAMSLGGGGSVEGMGYGLSPAWEKELPLAPDGLFALLPRIEEEASKALEDYWEESA